MSGSETDYRGWLTATRGTGGRETDLFYILTVVV